MPFGSECSTLLRQTAFWNMVIVLIVQRAIL